jgi:hypothetical protein
MATTDADPPEVTEKVAAVENGGSKAEGESEGEGEEPEYKVEAILEVKKVRGKPQYLIKWEGYEEDENSWEPEDNLDCEDLLEAFKVTPAYLDQFGAAGGSGGAEASKGDAVKAPAKKKQKTSVDDDYVEVFKEEPEELEAESDQDDDEWGEEDDDDDSDDDADSDAEGETFDDLRPRRSKAQRELQRAPAKRQKEKEVPKLSAAALASLRAQLDGCDKSKLAGMLEALLAGHPVLAPEVRQMLEPDGDADDGAGTGAVADDGAVADAGGAKAGVGADAD